MAPTLFLHLLRGHQLNGMLAKYSKFFVNVMMTDNYLQIDFRCSSRITIKGIAFFYYMPLSEDGGSGGVGGGGDWWRLSVVDGGIG